MLFHYGEPCLYPHLYEAIKICKQRGLYVVISDTAALFTPAIAEVAIKAGLDEVWLVLDGMDEETSTKIRGKVASFERSLANIHTLLEIKKVNGLQHPSVWVIMIRQPENAHQWVYFQQYWEKVIGVTPYLAYFSNFGGNVPEINSLLKQLQSINGQPEEDERVRRLNRYRCFYPWQSVSILSDGRVVPCCRDMNGTYVLGDLRYKTLSEIWNDEPIQRLRAECISGRVTNPLCGPCTEANNEIGLPARFYPGFSIMNYFSPHRYLRFKN
jgi:radical SAM protein with 4Fe4S-binding SPASM domain